MLDYSQGGISATSTNSAGELQAFWVTHHHPISSVRLVVRSAKENRHRRQRFLDKSRRIAPD